MNDLVFQPSTHSFASDEEYAGWLANVFSKEGRAENKLKRATRKRKKGKTKAAERLERRAGVLKAKAKGKIGNLGPSSSYEELWAVKFPWAERKVKAKAGPLGVAEGYRPLRSQVRSEWRATILGGLVALQAAGIEGYSNVVVENLPQKMLQSDLADKKLLLAVAEATGKEPKDLKAAATVVQKAVIKNDLEAVAWPARAIPMLGAVAKRAAISGAASGLTATGLGIAATATLGVSPGPQAIVTIPVSVILSAASAITGAVAGAKQIKVTRAKGKAERFQQEVVANLENWAAAKHVQVTTLGIERTKAKLAFQEETARKVGELKGQETVDAVRILAWAGGISFAVVASAIVIRQIRS